MAQGTVKHFDAKSRSGSVVLDDGTQIPIPAEVFTASGLLELRFGQRVRFDLDLDSGDGQRLMRTIDLVTMSRG